jgi:HK97 family phage prohead protease
MEFKSTGSVSDVDKGSRRVKMVVSSTDELDLDNDVIDSKAFDKTLKERGPQGKNLIYFLRDHNPSISNGLIGKFSELSMQGKQLIGVATPPNTVTGNEMMEHYSNGTIGQHSIGFTTIESEDKKTYRFISQVKMYEASAVLWAANPNTPTLEVTKKLKTFEGRFDFAENIFKEHDEIVKELKSGKHAGDNYELLVLRFENIDTLIKTLLLSTEAAGKAPLPENPGKLTERVKALNGLFAAKNTQAANDTAQLKRISDGLAGRLRAMQH